MLEQDVREDIITPLFHRLGYEKDSENDIRREQFLILRYNKESLGRQKPKTDPPLSGYADYILEIDNKIRWVIEAKPPANPITETDAGQAYSYAKHPEVRAVLFCLCNGRELKIYRTDSLPESALVYSISYDDFESKFDEITNILSPNSMRRTGHDVEIDIGKPISSGLGSMAQISGGYFRYISSKPPNPVLSELFFTVISGVIMRNESENLVGVINTRSPILSAQKLSERIGTDKIEFESADSVISTDSLIPTIFTSASTLVIQRGERILDFAFPQTVEYQVETVVKGYLQGLIFKGEFQVLMKTSIVSMNLETPGIFELHVI
ncbi:MAG: type I restriction enzyme HsdR N-terminal domain-containing protein [Pyrinomonadaceae bacterium]|nr:type I restriction enzyme HsdR N-terminal domain-containing protein [Pyrinomonadaceae bacterium]